jgi:hypothetical protein
MCVSRISRHCADWMSSDSTYIRLTKLRELPGPSGDERGKPPTGATSEGSPDHHLVVGYVIDGWFLEAPRVGSRMVLLRYRRNGVVQLGLFTSSPVTFVGETEIQTVNSVYQLEHRSFEQRQQLAD